MSPSVPRYPHGALFRHGVAVSIGALGLALGWVLPIHGSYKLPFVACYTVLILVSAALGGFWPGLVCTMLCAAGVAAWLEPQGSFGVGEPAEIAGVGVFIVSGVIVSAISERMHRAMRFERAARLLAEQTIAAEQRAGEATRQALQAGVAAQQDREEMLALVAHDLQDPLAVIELSAGLIEKLVVADEQVLRRTAILHRTVQRMTRLVRDLLDSSLLAAGELSVDLGPQSVDQLFAETVEEHAPAAQLKSVRLDYEVPGGLPRVNCDRDRVLQVLSNLVANALRFTPWGGRVQLRACALDGFVWMTVSDTGTGISAEMLPHVFEPYSRERRQQGGRTGLGLSIAKAVVERHGGTIDVESKEAAGSTFSFTLPVAAPHPAQAVSQP